MKRLIPSCDCEHRSDRRQALVTLGVGATLVACGSPGSVSDTGSDAGTGNDMATGSDGQMSTSQLGLDVTAASTATSIGGQVPQAGHVFLITNLTLRNISVPSPIMANLAVYTLTTSASLVYMASVASASLPAACPTTTMVAAGGMISCQLAFEIGMSETATTLNYDDHLGHTASAPVPVPTAPCNNLPTSIGTIDMFPANTWSIMMPVSGSPIIVGHDGGGLYAFSAICTHQSCALCLRQDAPATCPTPGFQASAGDSVCQCHGATFDPDGRVTQGPATQGLRNYLVAVCNGAVTCDTSRVVPAGTRVAV